MEVQVVFVDESSYAHTRAVYDAVHFNINRLAVIIGTRYLDVRTLPDRVLENLPPKRMIWHMVRSNDLEEESYSMPTIQIKCDARRNVVTMSVLPTAPLRFISLGFNAPQNTAAFNNENETESTTAASGASSPLSSSPSSMSSSHSLIASSPVLLP